MIATIVKKGHLGQNTIPYARATSTSTPLGVIKDEFQQETGNNRKSLLADASRKTFNKAKQSAAKHFNQAKDRNISAKVNGIGSDSNRPAVTQTALGSPR